MKSLTLIFSGSLIAQEPGSCLSQNSSETLSNEEFQALKPTQFTTPKATYNIPVIVHYLYSSPSPECR